MLLNKNRERACIFLDGASCTIHAELDEAALPGVCATYPRKYKLLPDHQELSGKLSCPEVARLYLLAEDAIDLIDAPNLVLPTQTRASIAVDDTDYFHSHVGTLRDHLLGFYDLDKLNVARQTYLLLYLARRITPFFHRGITKDPSRRLKRTFGQFSDPHFRSIVLRDFDVVREPDDRFFAFLSLFLFSRRNRDSRFTRLVTRTFQNDGYAADQLTSSETSLRLLMKVWSHYRRRREAVPNTVVPRIEGYLANFCRNYWLDLWLSEVPTPRVPARQLCLFLAVIKFLFYSHPEHNGLEEMPGETVARTLDRTIVEAVQSTMRGFSHNKPLKEVVDRTMAEQGFDAMETIKQLLNA